MNTDFLIIGGGIIGLSIAGRIKESFPGASILLLEKEKDVARHGSGRNSGVLHAGFYYTADSLKARFCRDGNRSMRAYCEEHGLIINPSRKLVVARDAKELEGLHELKRRGDANGVHVELIDVKEAEAIEPNVRTHEAALFSPDTVTVDPVQICRHMRDRLKANGVSIMTGVAYSERLSGNRVRAEEEFIEAGTIINCAGLYADVIARDFGFCEHFAILPFKGVYLKHKGGEPPLRTNIYPVPNLGNPFLGVHFTITVNGGVKIGPTAIPAFWRENYRGTEGFDALELLQVMRLQGALLLRNSFGFRKLAAEEILKYNKRHLIGLAAKMVKHLDPESFSEWSVPGIRAQLLDKRSMSLVQDFVVEGDEKTVHILNAVSPAFTCSLPFADWVVKKFLLGQEC